MTSSYSRKAVIIGASSGIGAASARAFARAGWSLLLAARRAERLQALRAELTSTAGCPSVGIEVLDVTDDAAVAALAQPAAGADQADPIDVLVYCAGLALGTDRVTGIDPAEMATVYQVNVIGLARVVRALRPRLRAGVETTIVVLTSLSGHQTYPGGGGYTAAKHAQVALLETIRQELQADGIRVVEISPGVVRTEFALVKARGDLAEAEAAYASVHPLEPTDVADCILWAASRPARVDVRSITLAPRLRGLPDGADQN